MDQDTLNKILRDHKKWFEDNTQGKRADLREADLQGADLREADLDFSCLPLWCRGLGAKVDERLARQFSYHALHYAIQVGAPGITQELLEWVNKFHRVGEVPKLELPSKE